MSNDNNLEKQKEKAYQSHLRNIVNSLPELPGCYQYLDKDNTIIYVGKAKNLKRRVSSYFNNPTQTYKTQFLVPKIRDIKYIVVRTEEDALLLENKLIKMHQPHYNILLKDGKTYPFLAITKEYLPRLVKIRKKTLRGAEYFGPYSHLPTLNALWELCQDTYKPRPCKMLMSKEGIETGKYELCLEYHIKKCNGPCVGKQTHADYMKNIEFCRKILKGDTASASEELRKEMMALAAELKFEEADVIKKKYLAIENYRAKSQVISNFDYDIDVFNIESDEKTAFINFLHVVKGAIVQAYTFEYKKRLHESNEEILAMGIIEMRERYQSKSKEIVLPFPIELPEAYAQQTIPQRGDKKMLLDLSKLNVRQYKFDRLKQADKLNPEQKKVRLMKEIQRELGLESLPMRIEMFDNSNIQGEDAVAACVVFDKLFPNKKEYRHYNIKTVSGPDDYASMKEVVRRRYTRLKEEHSTLPNLIIADGGIGQMEIIRQVIEDELNLTIPIAGLAKGGRHRTKELLYGFPAKKIGMSPNSEVFHLLTRLQDEVHRFAISFHRKKRSKRQTRSEIDFIKGIGPKTKTSLLKQFKSLQHIKEASFKDLKDSIGEAKANLIYDYFHK